MITWNIRGKWHTLDIEALQTIDYVDLSIPNNPLEQKYGIIKCNSFLHELLSCHLNVPQSHIRDYMCSGYLMYIIKDEI